MNLKSTFKLLLGLGLFFILNQSLTAQNQKISIQGTLKDASGASVDDGEVELTFKLYHEGNNEALWEETATVPVIGGIYSHNLGSVEPLSPASIFNQPLFLGVTVGGRELNPRTELTYAPYAISVNAAQQIAQKGCSGQVGDIKYSILAPDDFAKENGDCWVPMDGRSIAGSSLEKYVSSIPDAGGLFLRAQEFENGADNDPDRNAGTPIATVQADSLKSHTHTVDKGGAHSHLLRSVEQRKFDFGDVPITAISIDEEDDTVNFSGKIFDDGQHTHEIINTGYEETRPKNLNFWIYIRIN